MEKSCLKCPVKLIGVLLLCALTLTLVLSCASDGGTPVSTTQAESGETTQPATEGLPYPEADYGGYEFRIFVPGTAAGFWENNEMYAEEETGEPINDAIYMRAKQIEDMYNIKTVMSYSTTDMATPVRKSVNSGGDDYDMLLLMPPDAKTLAAEGCLVDLYTVDTLNLDQPWWDQNCAEGMSLLGKLYMTTGEISYYRFRTTEVVLFNKKMLADNQLEDPYQLVRDKKWTIAKMNEMMKGIASDIDGDGKMTESDKYGIVIYTSVVSTGVFGAGETISQKNSEDIPEIVMNNPRMVSVIDEYMKFVLDSNIAFDWARLTVPEPYNIGLKIFEEGRALFDFNGMHAVPNLRAMDTEFGILPIPLYEEGQESYHHIANYYVTPFTCIPTTVSDIDRTGVIIDAFARKGGELITPAYYDVSLKGKYTRDEESREILDLVFSTMVWDPAIYYDFGSVSRIIDDMVSGKNTNFVSSYEKKESAIQKALDDYIAKITDLA